MRKIGTNPQRDNPGLAAEADGAHRPGPIRFSLDRIEPIGLCLP
jgi:hypothetical protein